MMLPVRTKTLEPLESQNLLWLRAICFLACIPSGGALLTKVYGIASLQLVAVGMALPCCLGLVGVWWWARQSGRQALATTLVIGFVGGLIGTLGYDLVRLPFLLAGQRVFVPISAYGVWLFDAGTSSRFTEVAGWSYHFANGITFGMMYALLMAKRHWSLAIVWALLLETIALLSPLGRIFNLTGSYPAIGIAYFGHIAYGLPLGYGVQHWDKTKRWLLSVPPWATWLGVALWCLALLSPLLSQEKIDSDGRVKSQEFRIEGKQLNPSWLRIERGQRVTIYNPGAEDLAVKLPSLAATIFVASKQKEEIALSAPGIYQIYVETGRQSQSSFIMVEPVEAIP